MDGKVLLAACLQVLWHFTCWFKVREITWRAAFECCFHVSCTNALLDLKMHFKIDLVDFCLFLLLWPPQTHTQGSLLGCLVWGSKHRSSDIYAVLMENFPLCSLRPFIHQPRGTGNTRDAESQTDEHSVLLSVSHCPHFIHVWMSAVAHSLQYC